MACSFARTHYINARQYTLKHVGLIGLIIPYIERIYHSAVFKCSLLQNKIDVGLHHIIHTGNLGTIILALILLVLFYLFALCRTVTAIKLTLFCKEYT